MNANETEDRTVDAPTTGTLGKAMRVLEIVANADDPLRFTDILAKAGQPRGTLHRQLSNLVEEGLLILHRDFSYSLGLKLLTLASKAWARNQFRAVAEPHLKRLHEQTGETVHLGILNGADVVYLDKVESRQAVRMHSQIGNSAPAYCTGVGKAALSALHDDVLLPLAAAMHFHPFTPHTVKDTQALLAEIRHIRQAGVAFDREEHEAGIHCVAAPVYSADRRLVAAVSVTGPVYRVQAQALELWADNVRDAAHAIMQDMASSLGPRS